MIDIGINYLAGNDECYRVLKEHNIINTLKFPGRVCDYSHMEACLKLAKELNLKIDLHGLPGMTPAFSCMSDNFVKNVDWEKLKEVFKINDDINRISTHIGLEHADSFDKYLEKDVNEKWKKNYCDLQKGLEYALGKKVEVGLENIPGGFKYDIKSLTPEYISENWKLADFGVYDISHAKLASNALKIDFEEYINKLTYLDKVKIYHVSGNNDKVGVYVSKPDKHVLISEEEIDDVVTCKKMFPNLDLIVSEYSFESKYSIGKELAIEATILNAIAKNEETKKIIEKLRFMEENLLDDISNLNQILSNN